MSTWAELMAKLLLKGSAVPMLLCHVQEWEAQVESNILSASKLCNKSKTTMTYGIFRTLSIKMNENRKDYGNLWLRSFLSPLVLPAGLTCLKEVAAAIPRALFNSRTSCQAFRASQRLMKPGEPLTTERQRWQKKRARIRINDVQW